MEEEKADLVDDYMTTSGGLESAIDDVIVKQKQAARDYDKQEEAKARALEQTQRRLESTKPWEFRKKKDLKEQIYEQQVGDADVKGPMEKSALKRGGDVIVSNPPPAYKKSGFKMAGSYHYGKKKKV
mgnify:CR=1 FL=1